MKKGPIITIDGRAGVGKSAISKAIAKKLGYFCLSTGSLYRTVGLICLRKNLINVYEKKVTNKEKIAEVARNIKIEIDSDSIKCDGEDVSKFIFSREASISAMIVSNILEVRKALLEIQRSIGKAGYVIVEGRDIGTVVFPKADVKIFLTASIEVRAKRRFDQIIKSIETNLEKVKKEVTLRDKNDINRKISPLIKAQDAIEVDTSNMSFDDSIDFIINVINNKIGS